MEEDQKQQTLTDIGHSRFRRVERLATPMRDTLRKATIRPHPPRGVRFKAGTAAWAEPQDTSNITHYNIYAPTGDVLERRVPVGQKMATAINNTDRVFVSSYNDLSRLESAAILAEDEA